MLTLLSCLFSPLPFSMSSVLADRIGTGFRFGHFTLAGLLGGADSCVGATSVLKDSDFLSSQASYLCCCSSCDFLCFSSCSRIQLASTASICGMLLASDPECACDEVRFERAGVMGIEVIAVDAFSDHGSSVASVCGVDPVDFVGPAPGATLGCSAESTFGETCNDCVGWEGDRKHNPESRCVLASDREGSADTARSGRAFACRSMCLWSSSSLNKSAVATLGLYLYLAEIAGSSCSSSFAAATSLEREL